MNGTDVARPPHRSPLTPRGRLAVQATLAVNTISRRLHLGGGTVAGGRAGLAIAPNLLEQLAAGRSIALVSGTNGKTTTTRLLAVALDGTGGARVVTNATGANMPAGHVAALAASPDRRTAVLEVDEGYLPALIAASAPEAVVLLNLSRDQLDRTNEVRMTAGRWRAALGAAESTTVVANADDPLVAWSAGTADRVIWVAAGMRWILDAVGCPSCGGRIAFDGNGDGPGPGDVDGGWHCTGCPFSRPEPTICVEQDGGGPSAVAADGQRHRVDLRLPGAFNVANAVMAAAAAEVMGTPMDSALASMATVSEVAGRFTVRQVEGVPTRLLLAKNPAGWSELLDLVCPGESPVVVGINARIADGRDPSWLWDVPFESLRGRPVVATGDRCLDLSVRLRHAEVEHHRQPDLVAAVVAAGQMGVTASRSSVPVDFIGNYTSFGDLLGHR